MARPGAEEAGLLEEGVATGSPQARRRPRAAVVVAAALLATAAVGAAARALHARHAAAADVAALVSEAAAEKGAAPITHIVAVPQTAYVLELASGGKTVLTAVRNMGALVTSFTLNGEDLILNEPSKESGMQGSTFWPSPQSTWSWPPPPTISGGWEFDGGSGRAAQGGGSYDAQANDAKKEVTFTSQPDEKLGIVVKKSFSVDEDRKAMVMRYTMELTNGSKPIKLAPWEKTNLPKGSFIFWKHGKSEQIERSDNMAFKPTKKTTTPKGDVFAYDHAKEGAHVNGTKIAANTTSNWVGSVVGKSLFVKVFQAVPAGATAPGEGDLAVFSRPGFTSIENQGAYGEITAEKPSVYVVCWYARPLPDGAAAKADDKKLMDAVDSILKLGCPKK
mmetsp:Transcript_24878/g.78400  ORF Transcript_24878/g.78400 Transcript_24878/m.78400 type:complete len:391 (-) Transcript_24878:214-1386(-)